MARPAKKVITIALILSLGIWSFLSADVKLRIYMQDGSLRAGNMISETEDLFVILTKSGREEVAKNKIMYVNGKTLAQWQARPDKFFQTEILPSEIPNPAYVNDKASMPSVPVLPKTAPNGVPPPITGPIHLPATAQALDKAVPVTPPIKNESKKNVQQDAIDDEKPEMAFPQPISVPAVKKNEPVAKQAEPTPVKKNEASATTLKEKAMPARIALTAPVRRGRNQSIPVAAASVIPAVTVVPTRVAPPAKVDSVDVVRPRGFVREAMAEYHMKKALALIDKGYPGQAIQELHLSTMLNKANESGILLLGKMYQEQDAQGPAEKYLKMPILRKNAEAKKQLEKLVADEQLHKKSNLILEVGTGVGALSIFGLFLFAGKFRKRPRVKVIDADALTSNHAVSEEPSMHENPVMDLIDQLQNQKIIEKEAPFVIPNIPVKPTPPLHKEMRPTIPLVPPVAAPSLQVPSPEIVQPIIEPPLPVKEPVAQKNEQASAEREAILKALSMAKNAVQKNLPPVFQVEMPDLNPAMTNSVPVPLDPTLEDREEAIKVGQKGDQSLQQAHAWAYEGKWDLARKEYRTTMALQPGLIEPYLGMGFVDFSEGRWENALFHYEKALHMNPSSPDAYYGIGRVLIETNKPEKAIEALRKALQLDPQFNDARDTLALLGKAA